jgi:hypothetical protein
MTSVRALQSRDLFGSYFPEGDITGLLDPLPQYGPFRQDEIFENLRFERGTACWIGVARSAGGDIEVQILDRPAAFAVLAHLTATLTARVGKYGSRASTVSGFPPRATASQMEVLDTSCVQDETSDLAARSLLEM